MTRRGRWLAILGLLGVFTGIVRGQAVLSLVSLSVFAWILVEWIRFQIRVRLEMPRWKFERSVGGRTDSKGSLWAGRRVAVEVRLTSSIPVRPTLVVRDIVPEILEVLGTIPDPTSGSIAMVEQEVRPAASWSSRLEGWLTHRLYRLVQNSFFERNLDPPHQSRVQRRCQDFRFSYTVFVRAAGKVVLPGMRVIMEDEYGLFRVDRLLECHQEFRILPSFSDAGELRPTVKRLNSLPQHGIHRLQRSGMGSELLELREYVTGDPPKSIAWKASARRDKLMTRQYESEVPVRVHLFVDGSIPSRIGGYGVRLLDQINFVAASIAKAAISVGDPVGGMLIDELGAKRLPWMSGERGFHEFLKELAIFSTTPPPVTRVVTPAMMESVLKSCNERFPELLNRAYHPVPWSLFSKNRHRYRVAGMLAEYFRLSPLEQAECMLDDASLAYYLQDFLCQMGMPWMDPVVPVPGTLALNTSRRMDMISEAITKSIIHARDNEVFVILADLLDCAPHLGQLIRVVKLALAKHHRVAFVCPTTTFLRPKPELIEPASDNLHDLLLASEKTRVRDFSTQLKRELARLGVPVSFSGEQGAIQMVISEMDLARDGRTHVQGVASR